MNAEIKITDPFKVKHALEDLEGIATLLLDAARHDAPERESVTTAARFLKDIHRRLTQALSVEDAR